MGSNHGGLAQNIAVLLQSVSVGVKKITFMTAFIINVEHNVKTIDHLRKAVLVCGYLFQTVHLCTTSAHVLISLTQIQH